MNTINNFFEISWNWLATNWESIALMLIGIGLVYFIYLTLNKRINNLKNKQKIEDNVAFTINRALKWISIIIIFGLIISQFGFDFSLIAGFMALAGGTIIGFASMSTLGNAIAGIIVMVSKPFRVGDRILLKNQFADVLAIDLIYTRLRTLDNVLISIPNQQLLTTEIDNYGKKDFVRRSCSVTVGYDVESELVEKALLEAVQKVDLIINDPKPYVWITNLLNFSVEYTLYVFTRQINKIPVIDSKLKRSVLTVCKDLGIDLSTPNLINNVTPNKEIISD